MRLAVTLVIFIIASVTVAGIFMMIALAAPQLDLVNLQSLATFIAASALAALIFSYVLAGRLIRNVGRQAVTTNS